MKSLNKIGEKNLDEFIDVCSSITHFDINDFKETALNAIRYYNGNKSYRDKIRNLQLLEKKWYDSLINEPDYTVYNGIDIIPDIWACWVVYSRNYLRNISSYKSLDDKSIIDDMNNVTSVIDLGCGIGYTTAALKELYPNANIFATNIKESVQFKICKKISELNDFVMINSVKEIKNIDLVFASEYFEHFENPIQHLNEVLLLNPKYLIIANAFSSKSLGHFDYYSYGYDKVEGKKMSRLFNNHLRHNGYEKIKTNCWNDRPSYWKKIIL